MRIRKITLAVLVAMMPALPVQADDAAVRKQIESQIARFQKAFKAKDIKGMRAITTPDFSVKSPDGVKSSRTEAEAVMLAEMKSIRAVKEWKITIESLKVNGSTATALVNERMVAQIADTSSKVTTRVSKAKIRETWVKSGGVWKYKRSEALSASSAPIGVNYVSSDNLDTRRPEYVAVRKAIEEQYAIYRKAVRNRDLKTAMGTMTSDVTVLYPNGRTFNRKMSEALLYQTLRDLRSIKEWSVKIANLRIRGNTAVATVGERMVTTFVDFRGALHNQTLVDFYQDTWVKTKAGWRLRNTRIIRGEVEVDGKKGDPFR